VKFCVDVIQRDVFVAVTKFIFYVVVTKIDVRVVVSQRDILCTGNTGMFCLLVTQRDYLYSGYTMGILVYF